MFPGFLFYIIAVTYLKYINDIIVPDLFFIEMKRVYIIVFALCILSASCARGISPYEAANGKAKCGRFIK